MNDEVKSYVHRYDYVHCLGVELKNSIEEWGPSFKVNCTCELCTQYSNWLEKRALSQAEDMMILHEMAQLYNGARSGIDHDEYDPHKYDYLHCEDCESLYDIVDWSEDYREGCTCRLCVHFYKWSRCEASWRVKPEE